jgi:hypothetical protein
VGDRKGRAQRFEGVSGVRVSLSKAPAHGARRDFFLHRCMHPFEGNGMRRITGIAIVLAVVGIASLAPTSRGQEPSGPPFDFSNAFYLANGIDPSKIANRVGTATSASAFVVDNSNTNPDRTNIRIIETTGGFNHEGNPLYYTVNGFVDRDTFTNNAAGQKALATAQFFTAYIFPKASGDPLGIALSNRRQDNVFDTRNGYFIANPLGIWQPVFVSFTPAAFNTDVGRATLAQLAAKNGTNLDGTPVITQAIEVDDLRKKGLVALQTRALDGLQGHPFII